MVGRAAALAIIAGCGLSTPHFTDPSGDDDAGSGDDTMMALVRAHSGTRLQIIDVAFDGGAKLPSGIHDSELDVDCQVVDNFDLNSGAYCVPKGAVVVFADAGCATTPVLIADSTAPAPRFGFSIDIGAYRGGAVITPTPAAYYEKEPDGTCFTEQTPLTTSLYAVGAQITSAELVHVSKTQDDVGDYSNLYTHGNDGMQTVDSSFYWDAVHESICYLWDFGSMWPDGHCVPQNITIADGYSDPACTQPVSRVAQGAVTPVLTPYIFNSSVCTRQLTGGYWFAGPATTVTAVYNFDQSGTCVANAAPSGQEYTLVDHTPFTPFRMQPIAGATRLVNENLVVGSQLFPGVNLFDHQFDVPCGIAIQPDGTIQCVPWSAGSTTAFSDAACTQNVDYMPITDGELACADGSKLPPLVYANLTSDYHRLGDELTTPLYQSEAAGCVPVASDPHTKNYALGAVVDPSAFQTGMFVTEPVAP